MHSKKPNIFFTSILILLISYYSISDGYTQVPKNQRPKLGLVLSGGGAKGLAHIGVLKVLEEAGIEVDMLGGTSMGSIVAGLYSVGYSALELEEIALELDWVHVITDKIHRNALSVKEKEEYDKFLVNFPFEKFKFELPAGIGAGQNISMVLSKLALPVAEISDFNKLPIPFLCIATDIVEGTEVVLDKGYLPDAIRASMAMSTILSPVEIDNRLLVDGGFINNFPVDRVKEMGAEIIIGVNLGLKDYTKDELKNLATVLEQSLFFHAKERNKQNKALCNILISPDVYSSNASSFTDVENLIKVGEEAARKILPQLERLADSLKNLGPGIEKTKMPSHNTILIDEIEYAGLENVSRRFLEGKLKLSAPAHFSIEEIEAAIERAYGTLFFRKITYRITSLPDGNSKLHILAEETKADALRLGIRYDSQFQTQLLINTTFRNLLIKGSRLSFDLQLGKSPRLTLDYKIHTGWKPSKKHLAKSKKQRFGFLPDIGLHLDSRSLDVYAYDHSSIAASYLHSYFNTKLYAASALSNSMYIEGGFSANLSQFKPEISQSDAILNDQFFETFLLYKYDSRNTKSYYNKGMLLVTGINGYWDMHMKDYGFTPFQMWTLQAEKSIPMGEKMCLKPKLATGLTLGDSIPINNRFYLGGQKSLFKSTPNVISFSGLKFMEEWNYSAMVVSLSYEWQFFNNHFLILDGDLGKISAQWETIFLDTNDILSGYGLRYGYSSIIGPIEIGFHKAGHKSSKWVSSINIGLFF